MEEIVRKLEYNTRQSWESKVKRPLPALISGILLFLLSVGGALFFAFSFFVLYESGGRLEGEELEGVVYLFISLSIVIAGAGLIIARKYRAGGLMCLLAGIFLSIAAWYIGIPVVIFAIIALRGSDRLEEAIKANLKGNRSISLKELSVNLKKTEADIEFTVRKMSMKDNGIVFDPEHREVKMNEG
ncbi:MAG: hypothetical protein JW913_03615 [Chitinispirillaceae bacterium]|nr:hypothetical protein [Chitinispirillaceae bacterium]